MNSHYFLSAMSNSIVKCEFCYSVRIYTSDNLERLDNSRHTLYIEFKFSLKCINVNNIKPPPNIPKIFKNQNGTI